MDLVRGRSQVGGEVSYPDKDIWVGLGYKAGKYDATIEAENGMSSFTAKVLAKPTSDPYVLVKVRQVPVCDFAIFS